MKVATGNLFRVQDDQSVEPDAYERGIRLCFAWEQEDNLTEGIRRLARAVRNALEM